MSNETFHERDPETTLDDCRSLFFQLYVLQKELTLKEITAIVEETYNFGYSDKKYKDKLAQWGFFRNIRRSDTYLTLHRAQYADQVDTGDLSLRVIDHNRVSNYNKRNGLVKFRTPTRSPVPQKVLVGPLEMNIPERFLVETSNLIKGSFESGDWKKNGNEFIINSSRNSALERAALHDFLAQIDIGCKAKSLGNVKKAFQHYDLACGNIGVLVNGRYHDHLPNILQKLNDLRNKGQVEVAAHICDHVAGWSQLCVENGNKTAAIYKHFQYLDMTGLEDLEERLMAMYRTLFDSYLGGACYNSFVMMMNAARRRLVRSPWINLSECLPSMEELDRLWGSTNRRSMDVLSLRTEVLYLRQHYQQLLDEAPSLIERATEIENDNWCQNYYLTKAHYFLGTSQNFLNRPQEALATLRCADEWEQAFRSTEPDVLDLFKPEREHIQQQLQQLEAMSRAQV